MSVAVLVAAGIVLALLPLSVHQSRETGHLQVLTLNGGLNLYIGNNPTARGIYSEARIDLEGDDTARRSASILAARELTLEESSAFWTQRALSYMRERPGRTLWLWGRKALLYVSPKEIPQLENFEMLRESHPPLRVAFVDFAWILPLAVFGLFRGLSARRGMGRDRAAGGGNQGVVGAGDQPPRLGPWIILILVGWTATIVFFATGRYRVPFLAGFLGLAGLGAAALVRMVRGRRWTWRAAIIPLIVVVQLLLPGYPEARARAYDDYQVGVRWSGLGRPEEALRAYQRAAAADPRSGEAWHGIGASLAALGRLGEAAQAYQEALRWIPDSARTHYNLGIVYGRGGNDAGALAEMATASRLDPFDPDIRADHAVALARNGRTQEAVEEFRRVLRDHPDHGPARRGLAALGQSG